MPNHAPPLRLSLLCLLSVVLCSPIAPAHAATPENGKKIFTHTCSMCHGPAGKGITGLAPGLNRPDFLSQRDDAFIHDTLMKGRPGTAMVSFAHFGESTIDDIVAFIRSWETTPWEGEAPAEEAPEVILPPGNADDGRPLFAAYCANCHGATGERRLPGDPSSGDMHDFLAKTRDQDIFPILDVVHTTSQTRDFSGAQRWDYLSDQERQDIVAFLRSTAGHPDKDRGKLVFDQRCVACHQADGSGLVGLAPSIHNQDFLSIASDQFIRRTIREGRHGTAMTPWAPLLGEAAIEDVVAYIRSWQLPDTAVKDVDWTTQTTGDAQHGETLFLQFCKACHGARGEGYLAGGPGTGIGLPGFLSQASDDYILETLKTGRTGTAMRPFSGPKGSMAALSDQELKHIVAYLRKLQMAPAEAPAAAAGRRAADPQHGELVFAQRCAACHQADGSGKVGLAPSLNNQDFLSIASDAFIRETILYGRANTAMTSWATLGDSTIVDLVAYIRSWQQPETDPKHVDWTSLVTGDGQNGQRLFTQFCAACHGPKGEGYLAGGPGTGIGLPSFLHNASDGYILETLKTGRTGTAMRPFTGARNSMAALSDQELKDIVVYLRSLEHSR